MMKVGSVSVLSTVAVAGSVALAYALVVFPYVWRTPLRDYIQSAAASARAGMRSRILSWSNNP
jgi:hypothetical protein